MDKSANLTENTKLVMMLHVEPPSMPINGYVKTHGNPNQTNELKFKFQKALIRLTTNLSLLEKL